ncbi:hypothetical protein KY332_03765 [Candidatus Woesearchaeota archaeon]|nr:hypothetical protein [Candidatus Woesearchaeota archaeon]
MKLVQRVKKHYDWQSYPENEDPTDEGLWTDEELERYPEVAIDNDHRFVYSLYDILEKAGAVELRERISEKKDKYGCVTDEIKFRAYQLGNTIMCIRAKTNYLSPDFSESLVEEKISIRIYVTDDSEYTEIPVNLN